METELFLKKTDVFKRDILKKTIKQNSSILTSFVNDFFISIEVLKENRNKNSFDYWVEPLIKLSLDLHNEINKKEKSFDDLFSGFPWQIVEDEFDDFILEFPEQLELPYSEISEEFQNKYQQKKFSYLRFLHKNKKFLSTQDSKTKPVGRIFSLHQYLKKFLFTSLAVQVLEEYQYFLRALSRIFFELQDATEVLVDKVVICSAEHEQEYQDFLTNQDVTEKINAFYESLDKIKTITESYKKESESRNKQFLDDSRLKISETWETAGSPLLAPGKYSEKESLKELKKLSSHYQKVQKKWKNHFEGARKDWLKDLEVGHLQLELAGKYLKQLVVIKKRIDKNITPKFSKIQNDVSETLQRFVSKKETTKESLRETLASESRSLIQLLRQDRLPALHDALLQGAFDKVYSSYLDQIKKQVDELDDDHTIFTKLDMENIPPESELDDVPVKELVRGELLTSAQKKDTELITFFNAKMQALLRSVSNLDQIVEFNLEAAYNLLNEGEKSDNVEEAQKIAADGLERAKSNIEDIQENFEQTILSSNNRFDDLVKQLETDIQKLGDNEKILELKIRLARAQTREKIIRIRHEIWIKIKHIVPVILAFIKKHYAKIRDEYLRLRKVTGLGPQVSLSNEELAEFLVKTERKIKKMPYVYQRLFRLEPLEEERFFYGRKEQMQFFKEDVEHFKQDNFAASVIVGEKGNGKTTILKFAEKEYFSGFNLVKIDLSETVYLESDFLKTLNQSFNFKNSGSFEQFEASLESENKKFICIIENIHNLYLRTIEGFDLFEKFLLLIARTRNNVFWIVTTGLYAWDYLDKVVNASEYFRRVIKLDSLSAEDIKAVIMNRHQVSGYGLYFNVPDRVIKSRSYRKLASESEKQQYVQEMLFDDLADISGGNIKSAILFWLSVLEVFEEERIIVSEKIALDASSIHRLSSDELFSLAAFIQHEYLNEEQHAKVFYQEAEQSRLMLLRLYKKGYLTRLDGRYSVHPLIYRPIIKLLKNKNIL